jgi:hypothetical protein
MMHSSLHDMGVTDLQNLAASLREGALSAGISSHVLRQVAGLQAAAVAIDLEKLMADGWSTRQLALLAEAISKAKESNQQPSGLLDLVLSGPDIPGVPTSDTAAVVRSMIESATTEILLVGYAVHNGKRLFEPLVQRIRALPSLKVRFCLDISRKMTDTSLSSEIVRRFGREFREKHWPWPELPEVFYDPRALAATTGERASLHAKCVIIDRKTALVTSANFTQAAQEKNIEAGVLVRDAGFVNRLSAHFDALIAAGMLQQCRL